jgi:hypothetical protein
LIFGFDVYLYREVLGSFFVKSEMVVKNALAESREQGRFLFEGVCFVLEPDVAHFNKHVL